MIEKIKDISHLSDSQYASADKLNSRWDIYNYAIPAIDIYVTGIEHLRLRGNESILEVGCGDGSVLWNLREEHHHTGNLFGLDINKEIFSATQIKQTENPHVTPIQFLVGTADHVPLPDQSCDVILAFFMLYHMPDIPATLQEWTRVLKPNGQILVATSSRDHLPKHKQFKKTAEDLLGKKAPTQFSSSCNLENAETQLANIGTIKDRFTATSELRLIEPEPYLNFLDSIRDMFEPEPTSDEWNLVQKIIRREVEFEIDTKGSYTDIVKRGFFIVESNKT